MRPSSECNLDLFELRTTRIYQTELQRDVMEIYEKLYHLIICKQARENSYKLNHCARARVLLVLPKLSNINIKVNKTDTPLVCTVLLLYLYAIRMIRSFWNYF